MIKRALCEVSNRLQVKSLGVKGPDGFVESMHYIESPERKHGLILIQTPPMNNYSWSGSSCFKYIDSVSYG